MGQRFSATSQSAGNSDSYPCNKARGQFLRTHSGHSSGYGGQLDGRFRHWKSSYRPPAQYGAPVLEDHSDRPAELVHDKYVAAPAQFEQFMVKNDVLDLSDPELLVEAERVSHKRLIDDTFTKHYHSRKDLRLLYSRDTNKKEQDDLEALGSQVRPGNQNIELLFTNDEELSLETQPTNILSSDLWDLFPKYEKPNEELIEATTDLVEWPCTAPSTNVPRMQERTIKEQTSPPTPELVETKVEVSETAVDRQPISVIEINNPVTNETEVSMSASDALISDLLQYFKSTPIASTPYKKIVESLSRPAEECFDPRFLNLKRLSKLLTESPELNIVRYLIELGSHWGLDELSNMHLKPLLYHIPNSVLTE